MALSATIFKADLDISDMDRHYYAHHALTLAMHPSETEERLMVRLLAFALNADEALGFTRGLSAEDEPDLWKKDLTGEIDLWIEVGQPDERRLRKACGRARKVLVYAFGGRSADIWWDKTAKDLARLDNLSVIKLPEESSAALETMAQRTMRLSCTIQDGDVWLTDGQSNVQIHLTPLKTVSSA
ncbi:MAG: YaeQ family protein [Halothiobacillaceae bacterium]|nr:MAG: YaeQ family protein [Halothiobacillaceae bacterium]